MIKQIITTTTLVAAAAAMANAAETLITTTFNRTSATGCTAISAETLDLAGTITSTGIVCDKNYKHSGSLASNPQIVSPDANVGTGGSWTTTLTYNFGADYTSALNLSAVEFDICLFGGSGGWQSNANTRKADFELTVTIGGDAAAVVPLQNKSFTGNGSPNPEGTIAFDLSSIIGLQGVSLAGQTVGLALHTERSTGETLGCFYGFDEARILGASAIPEPSMFGLLAGLGALTLVGSRRRRK